MTDPDLERMCRIYAEREKYAAPAADLAYHFILAQRQRAMQTALRRLNIVRLASLEILEVGCGGGGVLEELSALGANPARLAGVDLLENRLLEARQRLPAACLLKADGQNLPFRASRFDLALQFTAFSSVLDERIRQRMAAEMLRVVKPQGAILWYDFWWNPTNRDTRGIGPREIRALFPGCTYHIQRVTLAPPIARRLVPRNWRAAVLMDNLRIFNSHFFAVIQSSKTATR